MYYDIMKSSGLLASDEPCVFWRMPFYVVVKRGLEIQENKRISMKEECEYLRLSRGTVKTG